MSRECRIQTGTRQFVIVRYPFHAEEFVGSLHFPAIFGSILQSRYPFSFWFPIFLGDLLQHFRGVAEHSFSSIASSCGHKASLLIQVFVIPF